MNPVVFPILVVSMFTWMTPMPQHSEGLLVTYGSQQLVEANAAYHGYDLALYNRRCGVSGMSPSDLGRVIWLRVSGRGWFGPCLIVDVAAQRDFYHIVAQKREIAEVPRWMSKMFAFEHGSSRWGEVWVGLCPSDYHTPVRYAPVMYSEFEGPYYSGSNPRARSPEQQIPIECNRSFNERR